MVTVPNVVTDAPALRKSPVFLYFSDRFTRPQPFRPDIVVAIDMCLRRRSPCSMPTSHKCTNGSPGSTEHLIRSRKSRRPERNGSPNSVPAACCLSGSRLWKNGMALKRLRCSYSGQGTVTMPRGGWCHPIRARILARTSASCSGDARVIPAPRESRDRRRRRSSEACLASRRRSPDRGAGREPRDWCACAGPSSQLS